MERTEFDVMIVGGGHHGLTCAAYLARAGADVCVLEGRHEWGGALYTAEPTAPGFCHNIHANFMEFLHIMPFFEDFDLQSLGARTIYPEVQAGMAFKDGRPPVLVYRNDDIEATARTFARYSQRDADTWRDLKAKANMLEPLMAAGLYTPPPRWDPNQPLPDPMVTFATAFPMFGLDAELAYKSIRDCIDELFESDEVRAMFYRIAIEFAGPSLEWPGAGFFFLFSCLFMPGCWRMIVGGTHRLNGAMVTACLREASRCARRAASSGSSCVAAALRRSSWSTAGATRRAKRW